jgi:hypothetical protein
MMALLHAHPLPIPPHTRGWRAPERNASGEGAGRCLWRDLVTPTARHLPLHGGGWEGGVFVSNFGEVA